MLNIEFRGDSSNPLYEGNKNLHEGNLYVGNELVTELVTPEGVTKIKDHAFIGCNSITSVTIADPVNSIGENAFCANENLTTLKIGESVTDIDSGAFNCCKSLTTIYCNKPTPPSLYYDTFKYYDATLYVPTGSKSRYESDMLWGKFSNIMEFDPSGVEEVTDDAVVSGQMPTDYYDLNGVRVATVAPGVQPSGLAPGIYITRRAGKTDKVVVR